MSKLESILPLLRQIHLFSCLNEEQMQQMLAASRILKLREGERLFDAGQQADRFFLMLEGQVKLYSLSDVGNEKIMEIAGPGRVFAEAVMFFRHQVYPVSAAALKYSELCAFQSSIFLHLLRNSTDLCFALMADMSTRLHRQLREIESLALQNATYRVVNYLLEQLPDNKSCSTFELNAPKHIIASRVSVTPETLSRILHAMAREGVIRIQGKTIEVPDKTQLRQFE